MSLYAMIEGRKSCRKFAAEQLPQETLDTIQSAIGELVPLYKNMTISSRFVTKTKGLFNVVAPHYIVISGNGEEGELENVGFIYEQLVLLLSSMGLGSVWLGSSKDIDKSNKDKDIVTIAFGKPLGAIHRDKSEFKRKPLESITNSPEDMCIQAVQLAPSGLNLQPWFLEKTKDNKVLVYRQKLKLPMSLIYKLSELDMGIALSHYYLASKELNQPFTFVRTNQLPPKSGYLPFGIIN